MLFYSCCDRGNPADRLSTDMLLFGLKSIARNHFMYPAASVTYPDLVTISLCERTIGMGCDHAHKGVNMDAQHRCNPTPSCACKCSIISHNYTTDVANAYRL